MRGDAGVDRLQSRVTGLGKKVLIANQLAGPADAIFAMPPGDLVRMLGTPCSAEAVEVFEWRGAGHRRRRARRGDALRRAIAVSDRDPAT